MGPSSVWQTRALHGLGSASIHMIVNLTSILVQGWTAVTACEKSNEVVVPCAFDREDPEKGEATGGDMKRKI